MIGAIAGDIIGSRFEGHLSPPADFELFNAGCRFTDDTVCSLAVAAALLGDEDFATALRRLVRHYPRVGYGGLFLRWALADDAPAYGSWGNGAPMRVAAVGWLAEDEKACARLAAAQAAVTHDHPQAIQAAQVVADVILTARRGATVEQLRERVLGSTDYDLRPEVALRGGLADVSAVGTVPPALAAVFEASDWEQAVRTAVCLGGDTDTLACIAGAVAEAVHGIPDSIATQARQLLPADLIAVLARFEQRRSTVT